MDSRSFVGKAKWAVSRRNFVGVPYRSSGSEVGMIALQLFRTVESLQVARMELANKLEIQGLLFKGSTKESIRDGFNDALDKLP